MPELVLNPSVKKQLDNLILNTPQGVLLAGPSGLGKKYIAKYLAESILDIDNIYSCTEALIIRPESSSISIESVRSIEKFLSLKVPSSKKLNRAIIIFDAHKLGIEAQNALLKTLEEPPVGSFIIMTVDNSHNMLPTILSRLQIVDINKPDKSRLKDFYSSITDEDFNQAYNLSNGLPGLMSAIISDDKHPLLKATDIARKILSSSTYERLLLVDELSKDKSLSMNALSIIQQMALLSLHNNNTNSTKWQAALEASTEAKSDLLKNVQAKLVLDDFMLNL